MDTIKNKLISVENLSDLPLPGMNIPNSFVFSPDNRSITFLYSKNNNLAQQLFIFDIEKKEKEVLVLPPDGLIEKNLSLDEQLKRERNRIKQLGITSYAWAKDKNRLLVPINGDIYIWEDDSGLKKIAEGAIDARFSPNGELIAFVKDKKLHLSSIDGQVKQLTSGATDGISHGLAEYIAQEEMDRKRGFWWSRNSRFIAFAKVDERHIPSYRLVHQGKEQVQNEDHRYPFAGEDNAIVEIGIVNCDNGDIIWLDFGSNKDIYVVRVDWLNENGLVIQLQNREQSKLELWHFDLQGNKKLLHTESSDIWINLHDMFKPLKNGFIWASEKTGFRHLYLHDVNGKEIKALTSGEWMVENIAGIDESKEIVYFMATKESPLENHLYGISFAGGEPWKITQESGMHSVVIDQNCTRFVDIHNNLDKPTTVTLRSLDGTVLATVFDEVDPKIKEYDLKPPELINFTSRDGDRLYGSIYRPDGTGPFPTVVLVYGGPHAQTVKNEWSLTASLLAQYLKQEGFLVFRLDNRGSARRGLAFEGKIKHNMGDVEVQDQVDGINWLVNQGLTDPQRVGIHGGSYGGYMSLMCLVRASETFKVAVAAAPVTSWDGYDTYYTERYMGTPKNNPNGYQISSVMNHLGNLRGHLLLIHGMLDENVHFRHTARLIEALIKANKSYDLMILPNERHSTRQKDTLNYQNQRVVEYFKQHL